MIQTSIALGVEPTYTANVVGILKELKLNVAAFDPERNWAMKRIASPDGRIRILINEDVFCGFVPTAEQLLKRWGNRISSPGEMMAVANTMLERYPNTIIPYILSFLNWAHQSQKYAQKCINKVESAKVFYAVGCRILEINRPVSASSFLWRALTISFRNRKKINGECMLHNSTGAFAKALTQAQTTDPNAAKEVQAMVRKWAEYVRVFVPHVTRLSLASA